MRTQAQGAGGLYEAQQLAADRTFRSLQAEARDIGQQLRAAIEQRHALQSRLSHATGGQIPASAQELAGVDASIAQLEGHLASVAASIARVQIAGRQARGDVPPFRDPGAGMRGDQITMVSVIFTLAVLMPISLGIARRLFKRSSREAAPVSDPMANARLERLEQGMDAIAIEIERISEGQRFVTKVLTERAAQAPMAPANPKDATSPLGEKPFLALGAGPMETIRAPERQGVRQSITPH